MWSKMVGVVLAFSAMKAFRTLKKAVSARRGERDASGRRNQSKTTSPVSASTSHEDDASRKRPRRRVNRGRGRNVYVILLCDAIWSEKKKFRAKNPHYRPRSGNPCVYVGETALDPENRFKQHMDGYKSSKFVKNYGRRLLPEMYEHLNPVPHDEATEWEERLAVRLQRKGYAVWWY